MIGSLGSALGGQFSLLVSGVFAARLLGPEDRGHLALIALLPTIISQLCLLGIQSSITFEIARQPSAMKAILKSLSLPLALQVSVGTLFQLVAMLYFLPLDSMSHHWAIYASLLMTPAMAIQQYLLSAIQGMKVFRPLNICRLLPSLLYALGTLILAFSGYSGLADFTSIWVLANLLSTAITAISLYQVAAKTDQYSSQSLPSRRTMFSFGLRGFIGSASPIETFRVDQVVAGAYLSPTALGIYVSSLAFTNLPRFIAQSIGMVAYPYIAGQSHNQQRARRLMWQFFFVTMTLTLAVAFVLIMLSDYLVPFVFGEGFRSAVRPTQILLVGSVLFSARRIIAEGLRGRGYPTANTVAEGISWLVMLTALPLLVPRWNLNGLALGLVLSAAVSFIMLLALVFRANDVTTRPITSIQRHTVSRKNEGTVTLRQFDRPRMLVLAVFVIVAACTFGFAMPRIQLVTFLFWFSIVSVFLILSLTKMLFRRMREKSSVGWSDSYQTPPSKTFDIARLFYFAGAGTVTILAIRPTPLMSISDWFFLGALGTTIALVLTFRLPVSQRPPQALAVGTAIFACGAFLSSLQTPQVLASLLVLVRFGYLTIIWFWLGIFLIDRVSHLKSVILSWAIAGALTGGASIAQLLFGDVIPGTTPIWGRMTGFAQQMNDLGGSIAIALIPSMMLISELVGFRRRVAYCLLIILPMLAGLILSGSVSSWAGVAVGATIWLTATRVSPRIVVLIVLLAGSAFLVTSFQSSSGGVTPLERLRGSTDATSQYCTACSRIETNEAAWNRIQQHPLLGVGLDLESGTTETGSEVHNMVLGPWYEAGILGALGMILVICSAVYYAIMALRHSGSEAEWRINLSLLCSLASFLTLGMTQPILFQRYGWLSVALILASTQIQKSRRSSLQNRLVISAPVARVDRYLGSAGAFSAVLDKPQRGGVNA